MHQFVARDRALFEKLARYVRVLTPARAVVAEAITTSTFCVAPTLRSMVRSL